MFRSSRIAKAEIVYKAPPILRTGDDDLITGGLGLEGLRSAALPPGAPLHQQMRFRDIRGLLDITEEGGFGRLYGPKDPSAVCVPGAEIAGLLRLVGREDPFEVRLFVPEALNHHQPGLVVAPSSGSRGATGAIGDIGIWALTNGHALMLTDKGTGVGAHLLGEDVVYDLSGVPVPRGTADVSFARDVRRRERRLLKDHPHAVALKHAHSGQNVEADWPHMVLAAARTGREWLSTYGEIDSKKITIIAAGVSNGGGAVLRAAEIDREKTIDGVVAIEPNVSLPEDTFSMRVGQEQHTSRSRPLYDVASMMSLLAPVAALSEQFSYYPFADMISAKRDALEAWATELSRAGYLSGPTTADLANDAVRQLRDYGFDAPSDPCLHAMVALNIWASVTVTFANALGRFSAADALEGVTFAFADPGRAPRPPTAEERANLAGQSGGIPPSGGIEMIDSRGTAQLSCDTMMSFRQLWTDSSRNARRVRQGAKDVLATGALDDRPVAIVHGQGDSLIHVNHTSRPYMAYVARQRRATNTRYYEIQHGQHFETFLMLPGFPKHHVPLAPYADQILSTVWRAVTDNRPLPPSQRVRTRCRGIDMRGNLEPLSADHVPPVKDSPAAANILTW